MRMRFLIVLATGGALISSCALVQTDPAKTAESRAASPALQAYDGDPPVVPFREAVADDKGYFEQQCLAVLNTMPEHLDWKWGDRLLTQAASSAYIWRADYKTPRDPDPARLNRVICSIKPDGGFDIQIALDQPVEPLGLEAARLKEARP